MSDVSIVRLDVVKRLLVLRHEARDVLVFPRFDLFYILASREDIKKAHVTLHVTSAPSAKAHVTSHVTSATVAKAHETSHVTSAPIAKAHVTSHMTSATEREGMRI